MAVPSAPPTFHTGDHPVPRLRPGGNPRYGGDEHLDATFAQFGVWGRALAPRKSPRTWIPAGHEPPRRRCSGRGPGAQSPLTMSHTALGRVRRSAAHGVGDLVDRHVTIVKEVVEPSRVESVGRRPVTDVVERAGLAQLHAIRTQPRRHPGTRSRAKGRPVVARRVPAIRQLRQENRPGRVLDDAFRIPARFPVGQRPGRCPAHVVIHPTPYVAGGSGAPAVFRMKPGPAQFIAYVRRRVNGA